MKIEIQSIADKGNFSKERLVLKIILATDIGNYIVIQSGYNEEGVTIDTYQTYWFPYKSVSSGDLVVLYTKEGKENEKLLKNGKKAHFFYWGLNNSIWNRSDRAPVILHAPEWISKNPNDL